MEVADLRQSQGLSRRQEKVAWSVPGVRAEWLHSPGPAVPPHPCLGPAQAEQARVETRGEAPAQREAREEMTTDDTFFEDAKFRNHFPSTTKYLPDMEISDEIMGVTISRNQKCNQVERSRVSPQSCICEIQFVSRVLLHSEHCRLMQDSSRKCQVSAKGGSESSGITLQPKPTCDEGNPPPGVTSGEIRPSLVLDMLKAHISLKIHEFRSVITLRCHKDLHLQATANVMGFSFEFQSEMPLFKD
ncbi:hypothetical protein llap_11781 [Limosa lapponica baueri]|uniref:Uncharacterized protein n=1 Tax=Limosa lapponica baueri TaxID=1758121 RepID=A0A2I0TVU0_LIMLA|nr:hypothetical protein llap_11781 [Limosa lapponica baueri]